MFPQWIRLLAALSFLAWATSCAHCMRQPERIPLRVDAPSHPNVALLQKIYGGDGSEMVYENGAYILDLPLSQKGCFWTIGDSAFIPSGFPENDEYVVVEENGRAIAKLSVSQIRKLRKDDQGRRILKVK
jgi:hypothetical protein